MLENQPAPPGTEDDNPGTEDDNPATEADNPGTEDDKPGTEGDKPTESKEDVKVPRKSALEISLKGYNGKPFIGLEYVIEINKSSGDLSYFCCLCNSKCNADLIMGHVIGLVHTFNYMTKHFADFTLPVRTARQKKYMKPQIYELFLKVHPKIENKFGHFYPLFIEEEENFERKKDSLIEMVNGGKHFGEKDLEDMDESEGNGDENPPGAEAEAEIVVQQVTPLDVVLDIYKNVPIVGSDYVLQLKDEDEEEEEEESQYFCCLCEKKGDARVIVEHMRSRNHCLAYIEKRFPKLRQFLKTEVETKKEILPEALRLVCTKIEEEFGKRTPHIVNKKLFDFKRKDVIRKTINRNIFREPLDETFLEFLKGKMTYLKSLKLEELKHRVSNILSNEDKEIGIKTELVKDEIPKTEENMAVSRKMDPNLEAMFKKLGKPVIGMEFLVELVSSTPKKAITYFCSFCEKKGDPRVIVNHMTSYKHCVKYVNVYFPAAKKTILYLIGTMKECKRDISDTILTLCGGIQEEYGWLPPRSCDEDYFEENRRSILDSIIHGEHLREKPGKNFVEFVEELLSEVPSIGPGPSDDAPLLPFPGKKITVVERGPAFCKNAFNKESSCDNILPLPTQTSAVISHGPVIFNKSFIQGSSFNDAPLPPETPAVIQHGPVLYNESFDQVTGMEVSSSRHAPSSAMPSVPISFQPMLPAPPVKSPLPSTPFMQMNQSQPKKPEPIHMDAQKVNKFVKKSIADLTSSKGLLSKPESRSGTSFGRLSPIDGRLEKSVKWETYNGKLRELSMEIIKDKEYYRKNPEEHPKYKTEWENYWRNRTGISGKPISQKDITSEWSIYWRIKNEELHKEKFESMKQDLKRSFGLEILKNPERDVYQKQTIIHKDTDSKIAGGRNYSESLPSKMDRIDKDVVGKRRRERSHSASPSKRSRHTKNRETSDYPRRRRSREKSPKRSSSESSSKRKTWSRERNIERKFKEREYEINSRGKPQKRGYSRERSKDKEYHKERRSRENSWNRVTRSRERTVERESRERDSRGERSRKRIVHRESKRGYSRERSKDKEYHKKRRSRENSWERDTRSKERIVERESRERDSREERSRERIVDRESRKRDSKEKYRERGYSSERSPNNDIIINFRTREPREKGLSASRELFGESKHQPIQNSVINTGIVPILRILAALEDQLGSLGPKVNELLTKALCAEKILPCCSEELLKSVENVSLLETVKEKLRGQILGGFVDEKRLSATMKCINGLEKIVIQANPSPLPFSKIIENVPQAPPKYQTPTLNNPSPLPISKAIENVPQAPPKYLTATLNNPSPLPISRVIENVQQALPKYLIPTLNKVILASKLATFLVKSGKRDISESELKHLIHDLAMKGSTNNISSEIISQFPQYHRQQEYQAQQQADQPSSSSDSTIQGLPIQDLENLCKNYHVLSPEEKFFIRGCLETLERSDLEEAKRLWKYMNTESAQITGDTGLDFSLSQDTSTSRVEYSFVKQFNEFC